MKYAFSLFTLTALIVFEAHASTVIQWSDWEYDNAVARKGTWLVIKQPEARFCYVKQSYNGQLKMEMLMKIDNVPGLTVPFFRGLDGDVTYKVDNGPVRVIPQEDAINPLRLSSEVVPELKTGKKLTVRVKPVGKRTIEQEFSLVGFAEAAALLDNPVCQR